jgi:hypothetical protein
MIKKYFEGLSVRQINTKEETIKMFRNNMIKSSRVKCNILGKSFKILLRMETEKKIQIIIKVEANKQTASAKNKM